MKVLKTLVFITFISQLTLAQVAVNSDNSAPDPSAMLDVKSTDKGVLVPRVNKTQRQSILSPANGLLVFDTDSQSFWFHGSTGWTELVDEESTLWTKSGSDIHYDNGDVGVGTDSPTRQLHVSANNTNTITSQFLVEQVGGGDAFMNIGLSGSHNYGLGVDNSDSGRFKIGYSASGPSGASSSTLFTLTPTGRLGIGNTNPSDRLQVDASAGEPGFRVRQDAATKFRVHSNGGTSIGANSTPPVNGLKVIGDIEPEGDIATAENLKIESTGASTHVRLEKGLSSFQVDDTGISGNVQDNITLQTTMEDNKIEMNGTGINATTDSDILIQTNGANGVITIKAGAREIIIDENGGITINSGGEDITMNTSNGDFTVNAGNGNINLNAEDIVFTADGKLNATSSDKMKLESLSDALELKSFSNLTLNSGSINQTSSNTFTLNAGTEFTLTSGIDLNIDAGTTLDLDGTNNMTINAPLIQLNNGGLGAARLTDITVGSPTSQQINTASATVLIGG